MKPRQPAFERKVLIPEEETHLSPGESLGDFFEQGGIMEKFVRCLIICLLCFAMMISFVSCGGDDVDEETSKADECTEDLSNVKYYKPVIYLYPEADTICSVKLTLDGEVTCTYPEYEADGWQNFVARPDGTLVFPNGREYYCLYWEGVSDMSVDYSKGFCVKGEDSAKFLEKTLADIGLNEREANEFIIYWLPLLEANNYNVISFQGDNYKNSAELDITPAPDSILRVYMAYYASDEYVEIEPQSFDGFERNGFTVVEWGGGTFSK